MSLIEKAVERLEQLKRAGGDAEPETTAAARAAETPQAGGRLPPHDAALKRGLTPGSDDHPLVDDVEVREEAAAQGGAVRAPDAATVTHSSAASAVLAAKTDDEAVGASTVDPQQPSVAQASPKFVEIDLARLAASGMVTPDKPKSLLAEQFRVIKRPLIRNAKGEGAAPVVNGNMIMISSALPGEGKSFSAINLAISMAMELDFTVLLVDADFSKPSILTKLGLPNERGLMDVLLGEVPNLADVLLRTNVEKLAILPAGMPHPKATELIASDAMSRMLSEIAGRYPDRIIIFDSPPLVPTTEARVLATHMGQIVLVVEANRTTHGAVKQALATIESCPVKLMLLNKASASEHAGLYGYGYGYGYGHATTSRPEAVS